MPAKSESQRRLMAWALCVKRGDCKDAPSEVKDLANSMSEKDLEDFANKTIEESNKQLTERILMTFSEFINE